MYSYTVTVYSLITVHDILYYWHSTHSVLMFTRETRDLLNRQLSKYYILFHELYDIRKSLAVSSEATILNPSNGKIDHWKHF